MSHRVSCAVCALPIDNTVHCQGQPTRVDANFCVWRHYKRVTRPSDLELERNPRPKAHRTSRGTRGRPRPPVVSSVRGLSEGARAALMRVTSLRSPFDVCVVRRSSIELYVCGFAHAASSAQLSRVCCEHVQLKVHGTATFLFFARSVGSLYIFPSFFLERRVPFRTFYFNTETKTWDSARRELGESRERQVVPRATSKQPRPPQQQQRQRRRRRMWENGGQSVWSRSRSSKSNRSGSSGRSTALNERKDVALDEESDNKGRQPWRITKCTKRLLHSLHKVHSWQVAVTLQWPFWTGEGHDHGEPLEDGASGEDETAPRWQALSHVAQKEKVSALRVRDVSAHGVGDGARSWGRGRGCWAGGARGGRHRPVV